MTKATDHDILAEEGQHNKNNNEDLQDIARENSLMNWNLVDAIIQPTHHRKCWSFCQNLQLKSCEDNMWKQMIDYFPSKLKNRLRGWDIDRQPDCFDVYYSLRDLDSLRFYCILILIQWMTQAPVLPESLYMTRPELSALEWRSAVIIWMEECC